MVACRNTRIGWILIMAAACGVLAVAAPSAQQRSPKGDLTLDDRFALLTELVPSFGGLFIDPDRRTVFAFSTDPSQATAATLRGAIVSIFGPTELDGYPIVLLPARFTFLELKTWHDRARAEVLAIPDVVLLDTDDAANRLLVGAATRDAELAAHRRLLELGVPADAMAIVSAQPEALLSSLTDHHRPLVGGLKISSIAGGCTLGLVVRPLEQSNNRTPNHALLTNSHCTVAFGFMSGDPFFQPDASFPVVADEILDPPLWTGPHSTNTGTVICPHGYQCRYADAALARLRPTERPRVGYIAAPIGTGSTAFNGSTYRVMDEGLSWVGAPVIKVGQSSGRTAGFIKFTCADRKVQGMDVMFLCQSISNLHSLQGDSGSPVFSQVTTVLGEPFLNLTYFRGLVWGGSEIDGQPWTTFSPIDNLQRLDELKALNTCATPMVCY